jgi:hypothetical protein
MGWIQAPSASGTPKAAFDGDADPKSIGIARRLRPSSIVIQTFVAILYSHDRSAARPSNLSKLRHARKNVS